MGRLHAIDEKGRRLLGISSRISPRTSRTLYGRVSRNWHTCDDLVWPVGEGIPGSLTCCCQPCQSNCCYMPTSIRMSADQPSVHVDCRTFPSNRLYPLENRSDRSFDVGKPPCVYPSVSSKLLSDRRRAHTPVISTPWSYTSREKDPRMEIWHSVKHVADLLAVSLKSCSMEIQ